MIVRHDLTGNCLGEPHSWGFTLASLSYYRWRDSGGCRFVFLQTSISAIFARKWYVFNSIGQRTVLSMHWRFIFCLGLFLDHEIGLYQKRESSVSMESMLYSCWGATCRNDHCALFPAVSNRAAKTAQSLLSCTHQSLLWPPNVKESSEARSNLCWYLSLKFVGWVELGIFQGKDKQETKESNVGHYSADLHAGQPEKPIVSCDHHAKELGLSPWFTLVTAA